MMKTLSKSPLKSLLFVFIGYCILFLSSCGGADSTAPVDIPAPVSHLSVSTPDANGYSRVASAAGYATPGTVVTLTKSEGSSSVSANLKFNISPDAQEISYFPIADEDGAFRTRIPAEIGDTITATVTLAGQTLTGSKRVPASQFVLPESDSYFDLDVNTDEHVALILGTDELNGNVYLLDADNGTVSDPLVLGGANGARRIAVDPTDGSAAVIDPTAQTLWEVYPDGQADSQSVSVDSPEDIAFGVSGDFAVVTHSSGSYAACYYEEASDTATPFAIVDVSDNNTTHVSSSFVATDQLESGEDVFAVISLMSNDTYYVTLFQVVDASTTEQLATVPLTGIPGGVALYADGLRALVSDTENNQVYIVNFEIVSRETVEVGSVPKGVAVDESANRAYVTNSDDHTVSVISFGDVNTVTDLENVGLNPAEAFVNGAADFDSPVILNIDDQSVTVL